MEKSYGVYIDDLKINSGLIAGEIDVKIRVSPKSFGYGNYEDLNKAVYTTVNEITKAIKRSNNSENSIEKVMGINKKEYISKNGKLIPKK